MVLLNSVLHKYHVKPWNIKIRQYFLTNNPLLLLINIHMKQLLWFNIPWYSLTYAVHLVVSLSLTCVHRLEYDGEMRLSPVSPPTLARCVTLGRAVIRERGHSTGAALLQRGDSFPPSLPHSHCLHCLHPDFRKILFRDSLVCTPLATAWFCTCRIWLADAVKYFHTTQGATLEWKTWEWLILLSLL